MAAETVVRALKDRLGERITTAAAACAAHGRGEGVHEIMPPDAVMFARFTDEVAALLALCNEHSVPVIPYGAGTSLEGQLQAVRGGISLDLTQMDRILAASAANLDCHVEAGVRREGLNAYLRDQGLFFPLDPGANATLGGMASTRASGTNAVRYGTMRDVTLGLTVVTPRGEVIRTGSRARKSATGYDLTGLYVGAEGTLGVITELWLRLFGIPETIAAGVCQFDSLAGAIGAVTHILQAGIPIARIELLDAVQMGASIAYSKLERFAAKPTLFMEFHGAPAGVNEQIAAVAALIEASDGGALQWAHAVEDRNRLWRARHEAYWAGRSLRPGCETIATDACVPISHLPEAILASQAAAALSGLVCPIVGHVGDGNFHMLVGYDPGDPAERERAEALAGEVARIAIGLGGTCSGEHGVGLHRIGLMAAEHGAAIEEMRAVKRAIDPNGIMNPGKMLPDEA